MSFFNNLSTLFDQEVVKAPVRARGRAGKTGGPKRHSVGGRSAQRPIVKPVARPTARPAGKPAPKPGPNGPVDRHSHHGPAVADHNLVREAQAKAREIIIEAKDEALLIRAESEKQQRQLVTSLEEQQRELNRRLDKIDVRLTQLDSREEQLDVSGKELEKKRQQIEANHQQLLSQLEKVAEMTRDEARQQLLDSVEQRLGQQMAQLVKQREEEARQQADQRVQEILVDAMKHGATDYVAEYTISTVNLPSEEAKGKIIGKAGRNINAFEKITGVDIDLDTSPTEVRLSCFDPIRREIARISLERLIKDGRIQPTRIEEVVAKVAKEIDKITLEAGRQLCHQVGVYNLPTELMSMLGKFKYRFSYGQNLIAHTLEETKIGIKLAHELKADVNIVKLGCLLHDIGKVSDDEEGSHVELGVKIAKKFNMPQAVVDAIAQHHEDEPFSGVEQMIVYIADAVSGARPGARYENYEEYVTRLQKLEEIAKRHAGVRQAYAIQAGREIRVLLDPEQSKDNDVMVLATKIRDEVKEQVTYPGTVTVNVSRETRGQQVAG
ncbi:MAG: ribonuclease Y [Candidatus Pacebacteria bacterium CG10_big_fil_rev_8_21_14_0_10_56_10]|nr:MAG: ribonuclease Y [Candidatus Pacebacteria bacterium CG10_big_fil_rev_8_21_14_0_10_56_10]